MTTVSQRSRVCERQCGQKQESFLHRDATVSSMSVFVPPFTEFLGKLLFFNFQTAFVVLQDGFTPLLLALREKRVEVAELLVRMGADVHVVDELQR